MRNRKIRHKPKDKAKLKQMANVMDRKKVDKALVLWYIYNQTFNQSWIEVSFC